MNKCATVTVLMAVYNGERYLHEAIEGILGQTFTDFEFVIINDGSTDASRPIICSYDDVRIRLIDNEQNMGLAKSLNLGILSARGKYIARQDADDISEPERLAKQVAFMDDNPQIVMSGTWYRDIDADGNCNENNRLPTDYTDLRWALLFFCPFIHTSVIIRRTHLVRKVGFYNENLRYAMDYELWLRIAQRWPVTNLPEHLVRYRNNPYSMTATFGEMTNEGVKLRVKYISSLFGWYDSNPDENRASFRNMFAVLYGADITLSLAQITQVTPLIWQLQQIFCDTYHLSQSESEKHRSDLRAWLSKRYIFIAFSYAAQGRYSDAQQLYMQAIRLRFRTFFIPKSARLLYRLLLIRPVKALWDYSKSD